MSGGYFTRWLRYAMVMADRVILLVMDGVGIGSLPDASLYGDEGSNTLGNLSRVCPLTLPCLQTLGLGNLGDFRNIKATANPRASHGKMLELSAGKDTVTGHWEMTGIVNEEPFPTYPFGFPTAVIEQFEEKIGRGIIGNKPASGTEILEELGEEHLRTGRLIVYTSADSVFQVAAHEAVIGLDGLYRSCEAARALLVGPHNVCRVIARPFTGRPGAFRRTAGRRDFTIQPPGKTVLDYLNEKEIPVISIGKVSDIFAGRGFSAAMKTDSNADAMSKITGILKTPGRGLMFCTLSDFDTLYGHRNDPQGFAQALEAFDRQLPELMERMDDTDYMIITADHGCDPTTASTDHSREYVPLLLYNNRMTPRDLGMRTGFLDIGATIAHIFGLAEFKKGTSLL